MERGPCEVVEASGMGSHNAAGRISAHDAESVVWRRFKAPIVEQCQQGPPAVRVGFIGSHELSQASERERDATRTCRRVGSQKESSEYRDRAMLDFDLIQKASRGRIRRLNRL